jgi:hypothetical protein
MKYKNDIYAHLSKIPSTKESRIAYQSDWLEVYEEFLSIQDIKNTKNDTKNNNANIAYKPDQNVQQNQDKK